VGNLTFDQPGADPDRLTVSASGRCAAVALLGTNQVASIDLADVENPRLIGCSRLPEGELPYASSNEKEETVRHVNRLIEPDRISPPPTWLADMIVMPVASESEAVPMGLPSGRMALACTLPNDSGLALVDVVSHRELGRLPLHGGALKFTPIRPTAIAFAPERGLLAVSNRAGGVHLIAVRPSAETMDVASSAAPPARR
jgi:hypothetical protein